MKTLYTSLLISSALLFTAGCGESEPEITVQNRTELRQDAARFMESLKSVLVREMQANGIVAAVSVCSDTAQVLTAAYGINKNISIRRVSFKNRNGNNLPDEFESSALRYFEELKTDGRLTDTTEYIKITQSGNVRTLRYLKPIIVQPPCLSCHGELADISPEVKAVIDGKYPGDKATGYKAGDLRGAVSIRKVLQ